MSQIDDTAMSDQELRQYFLRHREDKVALGTDLDRLSDRPKKIITTVDDPEFDRTIKAATLQQMKSVDSDEGTYH